MKRLVFLFFLLLFTLFSKAQYINVIRNIEEKHQNCIDPGPYNMMRCTEVFYYEIDSMLNFLYNKLKANYSIGEKKKLKKEQFDWLKERDKLQKSSKENIQCEIDNKNGYFDTMDCMLALYDKTNFVKERVLQLIKRLKKFEK